MTSPSPAHLQSLLASEDPDLHEWALAALARSNPEEGRKAILEALAAKKGKPYPLMRLLGEVGPPSDLAPLLATIEARQQDDDDEAHLGSASTRRRHAWPVGPGVALGTAPTVVRGIAAGPHTVEVSAPRYRTFRTRFPAAQDDYPVRRMSLMIEMLAAAMNRAGSADREQPRARQTKSNSAGRTILSLRTTSSNHARRTPTADPCQSRNT